MPVVTSPECLLYLGNTYTNGLFWSGILVLFFIVVFGIQKHRNYKTIVCFATSSFFSGVIGTILSIINCSGSPLVPSMTTLIFVGMAILSIIVLAYQENNG
jgi:uncharacterized membrane protein YdcZ (DUF606 family)